MALFYNVVRAVPLYRPAVELDRRLADMGYDLVREGDLLVAVSEQGGPACVALVYDWPMLVVRASSARALGGWAPKGEAEALVRRTSDLEVVGRAVVGEGGRVLSLDAPIRSYALLDLHTPRGLRPWSLAEAVVEAVRPRLAVLVRAFTSPLSLGLAGSCCAARAPLVAPGCARGYLGRWRGPTMLVGSRDGELPCEGVDEEDLAAALRVLRGLATRGC